MITFNYTGAVQLYHVPKDVCAFDVQVFGAQGGNAEDATAANGGLGGFAKGRLNVIPGETLQIYVGGQGLEVSEGSMVGGGFNGGGGASANQQVGGTRGAGGGASDIRRGPSLFNRLIVAGGGGGAATTPMIGNNGGAGGGLVGANGSIGQGGTQGAGGAGLASGTFGNGGTTTSTVSGAGGGGGWYGGGAATGGNSAGGGSGFIGGVANGSFQTGVQAGNGLITLLPIKCVTKIEKIRVRTECCCAKVCFKQEPDLKYSRASGSCFPLGETKVYATKDGNQSLALIVKVIKC